MSGDDASGAVMGSVVIIVATTIVRLVRENKWTGNAARVIVFGFLLGTFLLAIATVSPTVAKILAGLGVVGAFALNGTAVFGAVSTLGPPKAPIIGAGGGGKKHG